MCHGHVLQAIDKLEAMNRDRQTNFGFRYRNDPNPLLKFEHQLALEGF